MIIWIFIHTNWDDDNFVGDSREPKEIYVYASEDPKKSQIQDSMSVSPSLHHRASLYGRWTQFDGFEFVLKMFLFFFFKTFLPLHKQKLLHATKESSLCSRCNLYPSFYRPPLYCRGLCETEDRKSRIYPAVCMHEYSMYIYMARKGEGNLHQRHETVVKSEFWKTRAEAASKDRRTRKM